MPARGGRSSPSPALMQTGCSFSCDTRCIQSTRRLSPSGRGERLDHDRARPVGQGPAQETGVRRRGRPGQQGTARPLGSGRDGDGMLAEPHRGDGGPDGGHARRAHAGGGQQLHRPAAEPSVHHRGEAGHEAVALGRSDGEHPHRLGWQAAVGQRAADRVGGQFLIEQQRLAFLVHGVMPRPDAVGGEGPVAQPCLGEA